MLLGQRYMENNNYFPEVEAEFVTIEGRQYPAKLLSDIHAGYIAGMVYSGFNALLVVLVLRDALEIALGLLVCCVLLALSYAVKKRQRWAALVMLLIPVAVVLSASRADAAIGSPVPVTGVLPVIIMLFYMGRATKAAFGFAKIQKKATPVVVDEGN